MDNLDYDECMEGQEEERRCELLKFGTALFTLLILKHDKICIQIDWLSFSHSNRRGKVSQPKEKDELSLLFAVPKIQWD